MQNDRLPQPDYDDWQATERRRKYFCCREDLGGAEGHTKENSDSITFPRSALIRLELLSKYSWDLKRDEHLSNKHVIEQLKKRFDIYFRP